MPFTKDAFGKPRNGDWSDMGGLFDAKLDFADVDADGNLVGTIDITKRGFTDHEHLDEMQLIHMNGRMYDYNNGRFLSVDPFIQNPSSTQSMNPYTYIFNNPLSGVDPTGYISLGLGGMLGGGRPCGILEANCNPNVGKAFSAGTDGDGKKGQKGGVSDTNKQTGITKNGVCCDFGVIVKSQRENAKNMGAGEFLSKGFGELANSPELIDGAVSAAGQQITNATGGVINGEAIVNVTGAGDIVKGAVTGGNQLAEGNIKGAAITVLVVAVESKTKVIKSLRKATHKKVDYSSIKNPKNVGEGKNFTLKQKQEALELNKKANGGVVKSDLNGQTLVKPKKSKKSVTPDPNEWQFDHKQAKTCGGTNCSSNLQILSRKQNRDKSNN